MSMSSWNFTIEDTSPFLSYTPYADGSNSGLTKGWEPWYTTSGFISQNGEGGTGDSYHLTSLDGASVNLNFYGTAVYLYGTTNSSYDTTLDNKAYVHDPPSADLLLSMTGLEEGTHSVTLTARPTNSSQQLAFDRAVISTPLVNNETLSEAFYDNTDTTMLQYSGDWSPATAPGIPNATITHPWQETLAAGASVEMELAAGAVGVSFWGMANWGNWLYTVSVDGSENTYNGSTFWKVPDALLFYQGGLDPTKSHKVTLTNTTPKMKLALNSMRVYNIQLARNASVTGTTPVASPSASDTVPPSAHSSVNAGVIAGPIVAVVLVGLLCGFLWWRSRRNRRVSIPSHNMGQSDAYTDQSPHSAFPSTGYLVSSTGYPATAPSSTSALTSAGAASMYSVPETQVTGPPGATVMTWGPGLASYHDDQDARSHPAATSSVYTASYDDGTVARSSTYAPSSDGTTSDFTERQRPPGIPVGKMRAPRRRPLQMDLMRRTLIVSSSSSRFVSTEVENMTTPQHLPNTVVNRFQSFSFSCTRGLLVSLFFFSMAIDLEI
ncbi:hypothetical protein B0H19DRAFT_1386392 [Mycena capillaripes]|nr:hypothetical protein B0H19DRAFT_1386392 [Mycena capillaripes]